VKLNYLASPPLVVAYALAGTMDLDLSNDPLGHDRQGRAVFLADLWPSAQEVEQLVQGSVNPDMFRRAYAGIFDGDHRWQSLDAPTGSTFAWDPASTYVRRPPHLDGMPAQPPPVADIVGARVLVKLGDSITTDHISPAGAIPRDSDAGRYLAGLGAPPRDLNTFASRRGNHEVMVRGAFANVRLRNQLASALADPTRRQVDVHADGTTFPARVRLDTSREADYYRHGGVLPSVLRALVSPDALRSRQWH
jgi:aconitate hydratase